MTSDVQGNKPWERNPAESGPAERRWTPPRRLTGEPATEAFGAALAHVCGNGGLVFLRGALGAGKTTAARGLLRALGHAGKVKSPTYTLVEPYEAMNPVVYHFDLYRLGDPEELEFMGFRDFLQQSALCLVEWPEKGQGWLPEPDLEVALEPREGCRLLRWRAGTAKGSAMAAGLAAQLAAWPGEAPSGSETDMPSESTGRSDDVQ